MSNTEENKANLLLKKNANLNTYLTVKTKYILWFQYIYIYKTFLVKNCISNAEKLDISM